MLIHYFKIAFRNLLKNPIRSLFIFISLAVGLTLFVFTSYIVRESAYGSDESLPHYKRMAFLTPTNYDGSTYNTSLSHLEKIKEHKVSGIEKWSMSSFPSHTDEMTFEITPAKTISARVRFCSVNKEFRTNHRK